jgi:hypothetical protein
MANPDLGRQLLRWYATSPGQVLHFTDAAEGIHADPKSVNTSLGRIARKHPEYGLERVGTRSGNYVYRPDRVNAPLLQAVAEPAEPKLGEVLEIVGITKDGSPIARLPGDSQLWKLTQL